MTRYTIHLFQQAYPEQIEIIGGTQEDGRIAVQCWLLNEDKEPHMLLFDGGGFKSNEQVDDMIKRILDFKL